MVRRLACELWVVGKRHSGIVRDVSERGIYVQTRVRAAEGDVLELVFPPAAPRPELRVKVCVARLDRLAAHFATSGAGGLGLEVLDSPSGFEPLLVEAGFTGGAPAPARETEPGLRPFRVKLVALTGGRTQIIRVTAPGKDGARSRALARAGRGWKIGEIREG